MMSELASRTNCAGAHQVATRTPVEMAVEGGAVAVSYVCPQARSSVVVLEVYCRDEKPREEL